MSICVIVPTRDRVSVLPRALDSLIPSAGCLSQVLVVDDASTDNTLSFLQDYRRKCNLPLEIVEGQGRGAAAARNLALAKVQAPLVAFLDSDDEWTPDSGARRATFFDDHADVGMMYGDMRFDTLTGPSQFAQSPPVRGHAKDTLPILFAQSPVRTPTVTIRSALLEGLFFPEHLAAHEDIQLWMAVAAKTQVDYLEVPLALCHRTQGSLSFDYVAQSKDLIQSTTELAQTYKDQLSAEVISKRFHQIFHDLGDVYLQQGQKKQARQALKQALSFRKNAGPTWKNLIKSYV